MRKETFYEKYIKRLLDIILSFAGLVLFSWLYIIIAAVIFIDDPGPVIFGQKRVGKGKKLFTLYKFRSMKLNTPHDAPTHLLKDPDKYITKAGHFLRRTSLDEIPQLYNILKGDMSIIGPRPALYNQYDLTEERDKYGANDVRPGLTGLAQISGRDELEIPEKARLDGEYVKSIGFLTDLRLFFATVSSVLSEDGVVEGGTGALRENVSKGDTVSAEKTKTRGRVLMLTTVASTQEQFCMPFISLLKQMGFEVDVACNFKEGNNITEEKTEAFKQKLRESGVNYFQLDFRRQPFSPKNLAAYRELLKLLQTRGYAFVHCHTPVAGVFGRLAAHRTKIRMKDKFFTPAACVARDMRPRVIYEAHGFHFYKGAPLKNFIMYYPVERLCARLTDILIVINKEDYRLAKRYFKAGKTVYVPGVGIDTRSFEKNENESVLIREKTRKQLKLDENDVMLLSVGELNENKNHALVIKALALLPENVHYFIAGIDKENGAALRLAKDRGVSNRVHTLGYRTDIKELLYAADVFTLPSIREGLNVSLMEAMAAGLPCAVSNIRGNVDLIDKNGGVLFNPTDEKACAGAIDEILAGDMRGMGAYNREKIKNFSREVVDRRMKRIYEYATR